MSSPVSTGPVSLRQASSAELVGESPRRTRRAKRRIRPVRVMEGFGCQPSDPNDSGSLGHAGCDGLQLSASVAPCVVASE